MTQQTTTEGFVGIADFESYGQGWCWTVITNEYNYWAHGVEQVARQFRTNQQGNGLWIDGKQVKGTAQFSLPYDRTAARRKARRFSENGSY